MTTSNSRSHHNHRTTTRKIYVREVPIGGGAPVIVQSMNTTDTRDIRATREQIAALAACGCELTRVAVPDREAAKALAEICKDSPIPVVADIHFDYRLALESLYAGVHKIRINPGNIGDRGHVLQVATAARARGVPIRIGVNSGSLSQHIIDRYGGVNREAMVASAMENIAILEACDFTDLVISLKASDPLLMIESYRLMASRVRYPLHLGVTEAGTPYEGSIRSAVGIGTLLAEGIGDTIRVSLTGQPAEEVRAAYAILKSLRLRTHGPELISCPTCGRTQVDLVAVVAEVERRLQTVKSSIRVAVMGCAVNGPGEAREADIGLAGGKGEYLLFAKGEIVRKVPESQAVEALFHEIKRLEEGRL